MPIAIFQNDSKGLLVVTNTESLYSTYELRDPPARVHPICHLYCLSYYCPMNSSYQNQFNNYMYLAVQGKKSANPYIGHVMSVEWDPYFYEKESFSAMQPKEKDVEKVVAASEEGKPNESIMEKDTEISKDDAKTIQDEKDVLMEVPTAASEWVAACLMRNILIALMKVIHQTLIKDGLLMK